MLDLAAAAELSGETLEASSMIALIEGGENALKAARRLSDKPWPTPCIRPPKSGCWRRSRARPRTCSAWAATTWTMSPRATACSAARPTCRPCPTSSPRRARPWSTGRRVRYPSKLTQAFDYEIELGSSSARPAATSPASTPWIHVFGYTIINDVTARDLQRTHVQWFKGKSLDTTCPMGPWIVDKAEIGDPRSLELVFRLNGEERQRATVDMMIFDIPAIIESLSAGLTLEAGDVIATGTPSGVGFAMEPKGVMKGGDVMECTIDRIGVLRNRVVEV